MKKTYRVLGISALLIIMLGIFTNATVVNTDEVRKGLVSLPLTMLSCNSGSDLGANCEINLAAHRGRDNRLLKLKKDGIVGSGLFLGNIIYVRSAAELNALSGKVRGGDQIVLRNAGTWHNAKIAFSGKGSSSAPILIWAESKVIFTGESSVLISGAHIMVRGFDFKDTKATPSNLVAMRIGKTGAPCDYCVVTDLTIDNFNASSTYIQTARYHYVQVIGKDVTLAYSKLSNHKGNGNFVWAGYDPVTAPLRFHLLRTHLVDRPKVTLTGYTNGFETLYLGGSSVSAHRSYSLIENNLIERADGEGEVMTIKASDVIIRNNTFRDNQGALTLRHTARTLVEGNFFIGGGRDLTGGLRVIGGGHVIINNHFEGLKLTNSKLMAYWPLTIIAGNHEEVPGNSGYARVKNTLIAHNTFFNCERGVNLGATYSSKNNLLPQNVVFMHNIFSFIKNSPVMVAATPLVYDGLKFHQNLFASKSVTGLPAIFNTDLFESVPLAQPTGDIARIKTTSIGVDKAAALKSFRRQTDINGLMIPGSGTNLGNDDFGSGALIVKRKPYTSYTELLKNL